MVSHGDFKHGKMSSRNNTDTFYIYHHLGLGDHIVCNSIVRNICKKFSNQKIALFCTPRYVNAIKFMYSDIHNIEIISGDDGIAHEIIDTIPAQNKILIGHHHVLDMIKRGLTVEQGFFDQVGLKFKTKWDDFYISRNLQREEEIYKKLNPSNEPYIFLHEDAERNFIVKRELFTNHNIPVITPDMNLTDNIFDYITLIERAEEVHVIESCFMFLIDLILKKPRVSINTHRYARPLPNWELPTNRLNWTTYT